MTPPETRSNWAAATPRLLLALVVLLLAVVAYRGVTAEIRWHDSRPVYLGGYCWARGLSPYVTEVYDGAWREAFGSARRDSVVFAYPPTAALLLLPLGKLPPSAGLWIIDILNLLGLGLSLLALKRLLARHGPAGDVPTRSALGLLLAVAVGSVTATIQLGQTGFWVLAPVLWLWCLDRRTGHLPAALLLLLCTLKPTIALPFLLYFLFLRVRSMCIAVACGIAVVLGIASVAGGLDLPAQWLGAMQEYATIRPNLTKNLYSGQRLLSRILPDLPAAAYMLVPALLGGWLGWRDQRRVRSSPPLQSLLLLASAVLGFAPLHSYDLIIVMPLTAWAAMLGWRTLLWYLPLVMILIRPKLASRICGVLGESGSTLGDMLPGIVGMALTVILSARMLGGSAGLDGAGQGAENPVGEGSG